MGDTTVIENKKDFKNNKSSLYFKEFIKGIIKRIHH
jgi:hypothetical protein